MEEIYYVDRPSIPATQQNVIHLESILEHAIMVDAVDINDSYSAQAVEVRDSEGGIDGTLLYFPGATYAALKAEPITKQGEDEAEAEAELSQVYAEPVENFLSDAPSTSEAEANFNAESKLIDLDMELAEAKRVVQDIEDEIAAIEMEGFID